MNKLGTHHFVSKESAIRYYKAYYCDRETVVRKILDSEIVIGKPDLLHGESLITIDSGTRYAIEKELNVERLNSIIHKLEG